MFYNINNSLRFTQPLPPQINLSVNSHVNLYQFLPLPSIQYSTGYQVNNQLNFPFTYAPVYHQRLYTEQYQQIPRSAMNPTIIQNNHPTNGTSIDPYKSIPTITNNRQTFTRPKHARELSNLKQVSLKHGLKVSVFNAHSVQSKQKRINIVDFIIDEHIDIMFITESWLNVSGDEARLKDLTPAGYKTISLPRESRGGGLLAIFREHLPISSCKVFPFNHRSFELLQITLTSPHIHFFCLYRVPARKQNGIKNSDFATELPDLLEFINLLRGKSIVLGDFNVHFNKQDDSYTKKIMEITTSFDFVQGVNQATFLRSGNTVDWILYRKSDNLFNNCHVSHILTSDHTAVVCKLNALCPKKEVEYRMVREIHKINTSDFRSDVNTLVHELGPDATAEELHDGLSVLLEKHAPLMQKKVPLRKDPWYPDVRDELREAKRQRRRAERRRNKTKLTIDKDIFETKKQIVTNVIQTAKENYYCTLFENKLDSKQFSKVTNNLLGKQKEKNLPNTTDDGNLANAFSQFFNTKINSIRSGIDSSANSKNDPLFEDELHCKSTLGCFKSVTEEEVHKIIMKSAKKSCSLDPIQGYFIQYQLHF